MSRDTPINTKQTGAICLYCILIYLTVFFLTSCDTSSPTQPPIAEYGTIINYHTQDNIHFRDFSLHHQGHQPIDAKNPVDGKEHVFQIKENDNLSKVRWRDSARLTTYERFKVGEKYFFLELGFSEFLNKKLDDGEATIWTLGQYYDRQLSYRGGSQTEGKQLLNLYTTYIKSLKENDWSTTKDLVSDKRLKELRTESVKMNTKRSQLPSQFVITTTPIDPDTIKLHHIVLSSSDARLHLQALVNGHKRIIGVKLRKAGGGWKVHHETIVEDNEVDKQWVDIFMEL